MAAESEEPGSKLSFSSSCRSHICIRRSRSSCGSIWHLIFLLVVAVAVAVIIIIVILVEVILLVLVLVVVVVVVIVIGRIVITVVVVVKAVKTVVVRVVKIVVVSIAVSIWRNNNDLSVEVVVLTVIEILGNKHFF